MIPKVSCHCCCKELPLPCAELHFPWCTGGWCANWDAQGNWNHGIPWKHLHSLQHRGCTTTHSPELGSDLLCLPSQVKGVCTIHKKSRSCLGFSNHQEHSPHFWAKLFFFPLLSSAPVLPSRIITNQKHTPLPNLEKTISSPDCPFLAQMSQISSIGSQQLCFHSHLSLGKLWTRPSCKCIGLL